MGTVQWQRSLNPSSTWPFKYSLSGGRCTNHSYRIEIYFLLPIHFPYFFLNESTHFPSYRTSVHVKAFQKNIFKKGSKEEPFDRPDLPQSQNSEDIDTDVRTHRAASAAFINNVLSFALGYNSHGSRSRTQFCFSPFSLEPKLAATPQFVRLAFSPSYGERVEFTFLLLELHFVCLPHGTSTGLSSYSQSLFISRSLHPFITCIPFGSFFSIINLIKFLRRRASCPL